MTVVDFKRDRRISKQDRDLFRGFCSKPGQEIIELARELGLRVDIQDLPISVDAVLLRSPKCGSASGYRIAVRKGVKPARQRFSVAHEIGHYVLHLHEPDFLVVNDDDLSASIFEFSDPIGNSYRDTLQDQSAGKLEKEANSFAAQLLMPTNLIRSSAEYQRHNQSLRQQIFDINTLAARLGVSQVALKLRLHEVLQADQNSASTNDRYAEYGEKFAKLMDFLESDDPRALDDKAALLMRREIFGTEQPQKLYGTKRSERK